jgi:predicted DNA-binding WGR domain protein
VNAADIPISTISEARELARRGSPWRVRLTFVGDNPANLSGKSAKWWEASSVVGFSATVRWGVIGGKGQAQPGVLDSEALDRAHEKARKGYRQDAAARLPTRRPAATSLAALVALASWRPTTLDRLANTAGEVGLVKLDLPDVAADVRGEPVIPYLAADGSLWGVIREGDRYLVAVLRAA